MKQHTTKILLFLCIVAMTSGCRVAKTLEDDQYLLGYHTIFYNANRIFADYIQQMETQPPNKRIIRLPLRL
ncbi:MAG: hypothetical protein L7U61_03600, partial [Flavobacteriaceae bacterium]|nr:hypothetical protein [Flavobacteriaceae bacterium]